LTYEIVWADEAFAAAQVFMVDDPAGLAAVFDTVDALAGNPRPPEALRWGGTDVLRLRTGRYRVLYEIDDQLIRIDVIHPGRSR
jgi:mRNA interferase RelE/StbE